MPRAPQSSVAEPIQVSDQNIGQTEREVLSTKAGLSQVSDFEPPEPPMFDIDTGSQKEPSLQSVFGDNSPETQRLLRAIADLNALPRKERIEAIVSFMNQTGRFALLGRSMSRFDADAQNAEIDQAASEIRAEGPTLETAGLLEQAEMNRASAQVLSDPIAAQELDPHMNPEGFHEMESDLSKLGREVFPQTEMTLLDISIGGLKLEGRYFCDPNAQLLDGDIPAPGESLTFYGTGVLPGLEAFGFRGVPVIPSSVKAEAPDSAAIRSVETGTRAAAGVWNNVENYSQSDPIKFDDARQRLLKAQDELKVLIRAA